MSDSSRSAFDYTRGWGALGHSLHMWRSSIFWQLAVSLTIGGIIGTCLFATALGTERRHLLPHYVAPLYVAYYW